MQIGRISYPGQHYYDAKDMPEVAQPGRSRMRLIPEGRLHYHNMHGAITYCKQYKDPLQ